MISDDIQRVKLEACERSLEEFRLRCQELRAENELLHSDKEKQERDSLEIISYLRRDAERKDELIDSLKNTINQQREMFAQQREEERQESHEELAGARASAERMEADLQDSLASATDELNRLTEFKENKVKLEHDLQQGEQVRAPPPSNLPSSAEEHVDIRDGTLCFGRHGPTGTAICTRTGSPTLSDWPWPGLVPDS